MRYDVSDLVWSVIEPDGPFRERCRRYNTFCDRQIAHPHGYPDIPQIAFRCSKIGSAFDFG